MGLDVGSLTRFIFVLMPRLFSSSSTFSFPSSTPLKKPTFEVFILLSSVYLNLTVYFEGLCVCSDEGCSI